VEKSPRVITPTTCPSSTTGRSSTRWCRNVSATWALEKLVPTSTCSVFMYPRTGSVRQLARFSSADSSERVTKPAPWSCER
jgi:hypothetical protein